MQVGSLVKYGDWYTGSLCTGIVLKALLGYAHVEALAVGFVLVLWENTSLEWEEISELEVIQ